MSGWLADGVHLRCMNPSIPTPTSASSSPAVGLEPLIGIDQLSEYLGVPVATIYDWRVSGKGPCGIRVGRHLRFAISDVVEWVTRHREAVPGQRPSSE